MNRLAVALIAYVVLGSPDVDDDHDPKFGPARW